jgi:hypothetical protein
LHLFSPNVPCPRGLEGKEVMHWHIAVGTVPYHDCLTPVKGALLAHLRGDHDDTLDLIELVQQRFVFVLVKLARKE